MSSAPSASTFRRRLAPALRRFLCALLPAAILTVSRSAAAGDPPAAEPPWELPKFVVTDERPLPPPEAWRYARVPGLEILSQASDRDTQKLLHDFQTFRDAISVVWPEFKIHRPVPMTLVLCDNNRQFTAFVPDEAANVAVSSSFLKSPEQAAFVLNFGVKEVQIPATEDVSANPLAAQLQVSYYHELCREYVRYQLSFAQPPLPIWLEEGLTELLTGMIIHPDRIEFARIYQSTAVPPGEPTVQRDLDQGEQPQPDLRSRVEGDFNSELAYSGFMPLDRFFAVTRDSDPARSVVGVWKKQAQGLVHMWLYGENGRFKKGFAEFVARSGREPVTEAMFRECFKMGYRDMLTAFRVYLHDTAYTYKQFNARKGGGLPTPAPLELRDATQAEVGRIKGDAEVLAGHAEIARDHLLAPYARGEMDGPLLASLGLVEQARGETVRARKFLEGAARMNVVRPRAYLALANLRYAEARRAPAGADPAPLTADQTKAVLQPLLIARQQPPPLPEIYELMAEAWIHSAASPTKADLAAINQGVLLFQDHPVLLLHAAELNGKYGDPAEARTMAQFGIKLSRTPEARQAFEEVLAALPQAQAAK